MKTKLIGKHKDGCYAMRAYKDGTWNTPWAYVEKDGLWRDSIGRKGGNRRWCVVRCNCTDCPAKIMFLENDLLEQLPNE